MALNAYMKITGQKQGAISGSVTQKGREGTIAVHSYSNAIISPRDPQSGLPTGKRMHKPFVFLKEIDKSSPLLWNALNTNEVLTNVTLQLWKPSSAAASGAGIEMQVYTVTLTNASIASMEQTMPTNADPTVALARLPLEEQITLTYQKIQWTWVEGGITASDDWESPVV